MTELIDVSARPKTLGLRNRQLTLRLTEAEFLAIKIGAHASRKGMATFTRNVVIDILTGKVLLVYAQHPQNAMAIAELISNGAANDN